MYIMTWRHRTAVALSESSGDECNSDSSDVVFEFDDDPYPGGTTSRQTTVPAARRDFTLVGVLSSFISAQQDMCERDDYVHTYETVEAWRGDILRTEARAALNRADTVVVRGNSDVNA
ncbi:hypothetical protein PHYPSEUDO_012430 [Phytophthora pseudosyringae]|uniref:Uncharacterized protein n=1 Tax=Phytophthora pseudosyringae TaxID=221518 RepID=A0A8T1WKZ1_9STRA|nr:hypothetical protein PHYPSEUDO_012430 [Phytophthora pseudosyringae]